RLYNANGSPAPPAGELRRSAAEGSSGGNLRPGAVGMSRPADLAEHDESNDRTGDEDPSEQPPVVPRPGHRIEGGADEGPPDGTKAQEGGSDTSQHGNGGT